jgi:hypothetical protein
MNGAHEGSQFDLKYLKCSQECRLYFNMFFVNVINLKLISIKINMWNVTSKVK